MKITFYSNFMNHHQLPFALALDGMADVEYHFVACEPIEDEKLKLGYEDMNKKYDFIICPYESAEQAAFAEKLAQESDVIIIGSAPHKYKALRMERNLLTFGYTERFFKQGLWRSIVPITRYHLHKSFGQYKDKNFYMLCSSAYTSYDLSIIGFPSEKCFKWGYFPPVKEHDINRLISGKKNNTLLWVGRFLDWKHPEKAVRVAKKLKEEGIDFCLNMIGTGAYEERIKTLIAKYRLENYISLLGSMSPEKVRMHMEESSIFMFTSDFHEGWGAVLNEAMNSGCACVASHAIGSVPFLIDDKKNGFIYKNDDFDDFYNKIEFLLKNDDVRKKTSRNAYMTIKNEWNETIAAKRFFEIAKTLLEKESIDFFKKDICSKAEIFKNNWYRGAH